MSVRFTVENLACREPTIAPIPNGVVWNLIMYMRERCRISFRGGAGQFPWPSVPRDPRGGEIRGGVELYFPFRDRPPGKEWERFLRHLRALVGVPHAHSGSGAAFPVRDFAFPRWGRPACGWNCQTLRDWWSFLETALLNSPGESGEAACFPERS